MRREGRQRGWVCAYDRALVDPEGKRRVVGAVAAPATVANGGFVRAPRKPTNHSKFTGGRAFRELVSGKGASGGSAASTTGGKREAQVQARRDQGVLPRTRRCR
uniref:Uncharacterized protein n=1 Tax=Oryza meridionalis TaxID=40149 RepID=A0A0E0C2S1_9ORYZ